MTENKKLIDEQEALAQAIRDSLGVTPETIAAGHQRPGNTEDLARDLIARGFGFRRYEVPEPSVPARITIVHEGGNTVTGTLEEVLNRGHLKPGWQYLGSETQGEPSDALPIWERPEAIEAARLAYQEAFEADYDAEDCITFALRAAGGVR